MKHEGFALRNNELCALCLGLCSSWKEALKPAPCHCAVAETMKNPPLILFDTKEDMREKHPDHLDLQFPLPVKAG